MATVNLSHHEFTEVDSAVLAPTVPDYSQLDARWNFEPGTESSMCGPTSTKAVSDYFAEMLEVPPLEMADILAAYNRPEGNQHGGMMHSTIVDLLKSQGLTAWRRNWNITDHDPQYLVDHEDYSPAQFEAIDQQQKVETSLADNRAMQARFAITSSLEEGNPVIASVKPHFFLNGDNHLVVLSGIDLSNVAVPKLVIMDPFHEPGTSGIHHVDFERFLDGFNYRAVFAKPGQQKP